MNDTIAFPKTHQSHVLSNELTIDISVNAYLDNYDFDGEGDEVNREHYNSMFDTGQWACVSIVVVASWQGLEGRVSLGQVILTGEPNEVFDVVDGQNMMPDALDALEKAIVATQLFAPVVAE